MPRRAHVMPCGVPRPHAGPGKQGEVVVRILRDVTLAITPLQAYALADELVDAAEMARSLQDAEVLP